MPRRNIHVILIAAVIGLLCHQQANTRHGRALSQAFAIISERYVEPITERDLFVAALEGMTDKLDDHSRYYSQEDYQDFKEQLDRQFTGIGILVNRDPETGQLTVVSPLLGGPALEAGMRAGDVILTVDGKEITGLELDEW